MNEGSVVPESGVKQILSDGDGLDRGRFDKEQSGVENIAAKRALRRFYRWKYGELPPKEWQADHQVEQNSRCYRRFEGMFVHSIANLIYVPADINRGKNIWYLRDWFSIPERYRHVKLVDTSGTSAEGSGDPAEGTSPFCSVRDALDVITGFMEYEEAFLFHTQFSRDMLLRLIRGKIRKEWKSNPPQWLIEQPQWLERLLDDVENHTANVIDYVREVRPDRPFTPAPVYREPTQAELERLYEDDGGWFGAEGEELCPS